MFKTLFASLSCCRDRFELNAGQVRQSSHSFSVSANPAFSPGAAHPDRIRAKAELHPGGVDRRVNSRNRICDLLAVRRLCRPPHLRSAPAQCGVKLTEPAVYNVSEEF